MTASTVSAVDHLYERGHRRIGLLAGCFSPQVNEARYKGYFDILAFSTAGDCFSWIIKAMFSVRCRTMARAMALGV